MNRDKYFIGEKGVTNVYVSGCRLNPGTTKDIAGYGVYWGPKNIYNVSGGTRKNLSDNAGVLQAANIAMKQAARFKDVNKLRLNTNSKELFTATTNSIPKWKNKDWHSGNGRKVDENYKTLDGAIEKNEVRMNIEYKYLSPRKEHAHQSRADQLAVQGAQKGQKDTNAK